MARNLIGYVRVSTDKQGKSGLGIEAQKHALERFAAAEGFQLARVYVEIETGKGSDAIDRRPQLAAALKEARRQRCSIAVAKLDRLSRNVHFISGLMVHRVPFLVAGLALTLILSFCTCSLRWRRKNARLSAGALRKLAAAKARGVTLGNPKIDEAREKALAEIVDRADRRAANVIPIVRQIHRSGATSLRQIAKALNARGIRAPRSGQWHATSVRNVMARA
jgi:DNA invertase Pin-like site-specific DNA recombinase